MVERSLAKAEVAGSSPVSRSIGQGIIFYLPTNGLNSEGLDASFGKRSGESFSEAGKRKPAAALARSASGERFERRAPSPAPF